MIKIENLYKYFENKKVLNGLNLDIEEGTSSVIIGGSGTGKSVLIKCILGLLTPEKGSISIKNDLIFENGKFKNNSKVKIGMLFQGGALFDSLRIWQNVSFYNIQNGKNKFIHFYIVLSFKPEALCIIFFIIVKRFFSNFLVPCTMGRASQNFLVDGGAIVALREESLTHNCSTIWCGTEKEHPQLMVCRKIMPSYLKSLYGSMLRVMKAVVDAQGGQTTY